VFTHFESIVATISAHAERQGARDALIFLERGESESERLTYRDLEAAIDSFSAGILTEGLGGAPVMIALPAGSAFVALFLACLKTGAVAIPAPYPDTARSVERLISIARDSRPAALVTDAAALSKLGELAEQLRLTTAEALRADAPAAPIPPVDPDQPAFVQYTSGSTQAPKGIVITHGNLAANLRMIGRAFAQTESNVGVSWLPHYHDMGLIGAILEPLFLGAMTVLMPPRAFVQKPIRWLKAIDTYRANTCGGPCFGYDLCTRTIPPEQARALDLSCWNVAYCGAEPIRASVLARFAEHFGGGGFRNEAFLPCYGLAETTLITSSVAPGSGYTQREIADPGASSRTFVSCGPPVEGSTIVIRGEDGAISAASNASGEICVAGPHVSPGVWDGAARAIRPFAELFFRGGKTYLPTGDVGAILDGALFPIDRIKDIIILYGAKIHAADVEATVLDDPQAEDVRAVVAFSVDEGQREKLVVLCEIDRHARKRPDQTLLREHLRKRVADAHGAVALVELVAYGTLPRTSSGKIQRAASRLNFVSGALRLLKAEAGEASES
jgi:acyl-CoA synthetase (AMP-forming)/AMP-acid ligase II